MAGISPSASADAGARLARSMSVDLTRPWREVTARVNRMPVMPTMTTVLLGVSVTAADGPLPWVATLHGFVVQCADLTGFETDEAGDRRFRLQPPGEWFDTWRQHRVASRPGGRPWFIRRPRVS